jgi:hypothetical protein
MNDDQSLRDFVAKYARPYDPVSDDYVRPPFAADIKDGKNDPIYNATPTTQRSRPAVSSPISSTTPGQVISSSIRFVARA